MAHGGKRNNAGRKSKAEEFGLAELLNTAWPKEKQIAALQHIASFIAPTLKVTHNTKTGEEEITLAVHPKEQIAALKLLLEYGYGKPTAINNVPPPPGDLDLNANIAEMGEDERAIYKLRLEQYVARVRAAGGE